MSTSARALAPEAELRKLAHALGVQESELSMLDGVSGEDIRTLRQQTTEALFRADKQYFAKVAALSKTVPTALAAKLTELALPPLLAARTAELLEPRKAADLVTRLSERYLGDVSAAMDASRAPEVVAAIPADRVAAVSRELARRQEWVVIGGFVSHISEAGLARSVAGYDGEQLLRIGYVLDDISRLDHITSLLTDGQLDDLLAAAPAHGLWVEVGDLFTHLSEPRRERIAARFAALPEQTSAAYRDAVADGRLDASVLATVTG